MEKLQTYNNPHNKKCDCVEVFRPKALDLAERYTMFYFVSFAVSC